MTATDALTSAARGRAWRLPVVLGIALRELRSGFAGFRIFIACVALGVTVILLEINRSSRLSRGRSINRCG